MADNANWFYLIVSPIAGNNFTHVQGVLFPVFLAASTES